MIVRMVHPEHGAMHAYTQSELDDLVAHGWREDSAQALKAALVESMRLDPPPLVLPVLDEPPKRKYTRKAK